MKFSPLLISYFITVRNEVAKVMFLHLSVHRGGLPQCMLGTDTPPQQTATAADGTHPTGMHSC